MSYVAIWLQACLHWRCAYFQTLSWNDTIFVVDWDILYKLCGSANKWSKGFVFSGKIWWQFFNCNKACSKYDHAQIYAHSASCWLFSCLCFTRRRWLCDFPPKQPRVAFGLPYLLIELFYIGTPVVRTDGRAYSHVITKFPRMGRLLHLLTHGSPLNALGALELPPLFNNYSSLLNGLWVNSPWSRGPKGLLTQSPFGREE